MRETLRRNSDSPSPHEIHEEETLPARIEIAPTKDRHQGIELHGTTCAQPRGREKKAEFATGIGVIAQRGREIEKIYSIDRKAKGRRDSRKGLQDRKIGKIVFYCNEGRRVSRTQRCSRGKRRPRPKISSAKAKNARLNIDSVDIVR